MLIRGEAGKYKMKKKGFIDLQVEEYLLGLMPIDNSLLSELYQYGVDNQIPIMNPLSMRHVALLSQLVKPKIILEIGSAIGFSAIWLALANPDAVIHTIERDEEMLKTAQNNIARAKLIDRVIIHAGDAIELIPQMPRSQFVFVDAAKSKYRTFYELAIPLLESGGLFVFDNVLFRGYVADESEMRTRPMLRKLRDFNRFIVEDKRVVTNFLTVGDGLSVARKLED